MPEQMSSREASSTARSAPDTHDYARHGVRRPIPLPATLPDGLAVHCEQCQLVVPADAPRSGESDCVFVAQHKLAWFNPAETIAAQHVMAVSAWMLIYDAALKQGDAEAAQYSRAFRNSRKDHFQKSAAYKALAPARVADGRAHHRDGSLYK